ncbi:MAG: tetratricopeptide repeat protein [Gemmatimonadetes bacterium]|nr:tetratricopeptide repeat protein [Gemmatimonadota bacterium]
MTARNGTMLMLAVGVAIGGSFAEASAQRGRQGDAAAGANVPTIGRQTAQTRRAELMLLQNKPDSALVALQPALTGRDSANALVRALAAEALASTGDVTAAQAHFDAALRLAPNGGPALDARRADAWARLYNEGATVYGTGDVDATIAAWEKANQVAPGLRHEAYMNLGILYTGKRDYERAAQSYQAALTAIDKPAEGLTPEQVQERAEARSSMVETLGEILLFNEKFADAEKLYTAELAKNPTDVGLQSKVAAAIAAQPGREGEATAMYDRLLSLPNLATTDYHDIGVALFSAKNYPRAGEAFAKVAAARPNSREAWYNHANALYAAKQWAGLTPVAQKLVVLDPLHEDSWLLLKEAQRNANQNDAALKTLEAVETFPIKLSELTTRQAGNKLTIAGTATGNAAAAGTPVQLRFTFYGADGTAVGTQTATVNAPAKDATTPLTVTYEGTAPAAGGYKYELVR